MRTFVIQHHQLSFQWLSFLHSIGRETFPIVSRRVKVVNLSPDPAIAYMKRASTNVAVVQRSHRRFSLAVTRLLFNFVRLRRRMN
jgi:hypothetical protein